MRSSRAERNSIEEKSKMPRFDMRERKCRPENAETAQPAMQERQKHTLFLCTEPCHPTSSGISPLPALLLTPNRRNPHPYADSPRLSFLTLDVLLVAVKFLEDQVEEEVDVQAHRASTSTITSITEEVHELVVVELRL